MKPIQLADHLDEAARRIEANEVRYDFFDPCSCNCGVVAQVITGMSPIMLDARRRSNVRGDRVIGCWSFLRDDAYVDYSRCEMTGLPMGTVLRTLGDAGLTFTDMRELEQLANKKIRRVAKLRIFRDQRLPDKSDPSAVIRYLRAWARLIRCEHEVSKSAPASDVVATAHPVTVPELA
jgi:hypothetical protein